MHSITLPNRHDRDTFRCSRQLANNQVLQWEGYVWNQESCMTTSGIHLMTTFKHRIVSEQQLVNQNFAPSSRGKQYYSFPRDNITAGWKRYKFISIEKSLIKYRVVVSNFVLKDIFLLKWGGFERKNIHIHTCGRKLIFVYRMKTPLINIPEFNGQALEETKPTKC